MSEKSMLREVTLPKSGRVVTIKPYGQLEAFALAQLPQLEAFMQKRYEFGRELKVDDFANDTEALRSANEMALRVVLMCTVEPRYWADLRPLAEQNKEPWDCPAGRVQFDLVVHDFQALHNAINAYTAEVQGDVREIAATGFSTTGASS